MASWVNRIIGGKGKAIKNQHSKTGTIPFHLLQQATNRFDEKRVVGHGGFGKVYMGVLKDGTKVAVKWKNLESWQGQKEFQVEIELLPGLNHPNLVSLIGYCDEKNEMILVYEYMEKGTLKSHLYGSNKPPLSWRQRLVVLVGAAKGLHYLHTCSAKGIIHRDVKSENILLDENLCAKVGDFGLSKNGPDLNQTHVITQVKGTFGYLDPEYHITLQLTEKSDVYSFGVVLLEVLCGRPVIDPKSLSGDVNLVYWGKKMLEEGRVEEIVDQKISGTIHPHSLMIFGNIVLKCLAQDSKERPSMGELLGDLEQELKYVEQELKYIHTESESITEAGNSDESDHDVSSRPIRPRNVRTLTRSEGKAYERTSNVPHDSSAPSTSAGSRGSRGNTMNARVELQSILESINEAGNSHGSHHDTISRMAGDDRHA